ncbi:hypothetical protein FB567DRAFT_237269 [Paraphoma chrysanthemicola]|uniref:SET domain-containing protein n=1 Tax=Paraphoma chrysanthemicola TaxID=798071 RepID=A0A8K0RFT8_9PLEO|nr:hypothetical protein FB567DRAFT_237269 [Paraphoma chrysanthemicola]
MDASDSQPSAPASLYTASSISRPSSCSSAPPTDQTSTLPLGLPTSPLFEVRQTPTAGRAVFATQDILEDDLIWRSDDLTLSVVLREYRREICGHCFSYDRGRDLEIRDKDVGFAFCSPECQDNWRTWNTPIGIQAWTAVETLTKKRTKEDSDMVDQDLARPTRTEIKKAWAAVEAQASLIRTAREAESDPTIQITKQHRKAISRALQAAITPDVMSFCVSGLLFNYTHPSSWDSVLALAEDKTPYHSTEDLAAFTRTYLHLLAILPMPLLPLTTASTLLILSSRDSHNSFGIRSLDDEGSEFFGYGCWPAASYFNHSCAPNVEKRRVGRAWEFRAGRDVARGDELCITYLSGEERRLSRGNRMVRLQKTWGFECACERCDIV